MSCCLYPLIALLHFYVSYFFSKGEPKLVEQDFLEKHRDGTRLFVAAPRRCERFYIQ
jgi:hypothetical protein